MPIYKVIKTERTVAEIWVEADSPEDAKDVAQMMHVDFGKEEVLDADYDTETPEFPNIESMGKFVYNREGYKDADRKQHGKDSPIK